MQTGGNVYLNGARPYAKEAQAVVRSEINPDVKLIEEDGNVYLQAAFGEMLSECKTTPVTTEMLGKARIPGVPYENADGSPVRVETDYFGKKRENLNPAPGPFEQPGGGRIKVKL